MSDLDWPTLPTIKNKFYLVQRCLERDKAAKHYKAGADQILSFDYMGSAEFEWGTLPHTFKMLRDLGTAGELQIGNTKDSPSPAYVLIRTNHSGS